MPKPGTVESKTRQSIDFDFDFDFYLSGFTVKFLIVCLFLHRRRSTESRATMAPSPLFFTAELLEAILLQVDPHTLLTSALRVCRFWNRLIQQSNLLQMVLFFKPYRPYRSFYWEEEEDDGGDDNPFLERLWSPIFFRRDFSTWSFPFLANPLTSWLVPHQIDVYLRREASWRRMLIHQPPSWRSEIYLRDSYYGGVQSTGIHLDLTATDYPRLGPLYSLIRKKYLTLGWGTFTFQRGRLVCRPSLRGDSYRVIPW